MENQRICSNCKNFKRYYTLNVSLRFKPTDKGYCIKRKSRGSGRKREVLQEETCELWQTNEQKKKEDKYLAENVLLDISKKLEAIRSILSEEEK